MSARHYLLRPGGRANSLRGAHLLSPGKRTLAARFDAVQTTNESMRFWTWADGLDAVAALSPDVRRKMRNYSRYEVANNSYAQGVVKTLVNDCVGTGPRVQVIVSKNKEDNTKTERLWGAWCKERKFARKVKQLRRARIQSGEGFLSLETELSRPYARAFGHQADRGGSDRHARPLVPDRTTYRRRSL